MSIAAGTPTRFELWGSVIILVATLFVVNRWHDGYDRERLKILKDIANGVSNLPQVIQQNHQEVTIESDAIRLAREILIEQGHLSSKKE